MHYSKHVSWCETECKNVPLGKQNLMKFEVFFYLRRIKNCSEEKEGGGEGKERGLTKGAQRG